MCEAFFASLECELIDRSRWRTNSHSALGYLSPAQFQKRVQTNAA
jgi:transposase InsO family protein